MSFLVAAGDCPDVFPGGCWWLPWCLSWWLVAFGSPWLPWCLSWRLLVVTLMFLLVAAGDYPDVFPGGSWCLPLAVTLMSFLLAASDYPDIFPGGCWWLPQCLSWWLLVVTLMSFLVAASDYPDVFPGGCWWLPWCLSWWLLVICLFFLRAPFGQYGPVAATWALSVYRSRLAPWTRGESNHGKLSALRPLGHGRYRFATASAGCWWFAWCLSWRLLVVTLMSFLLAAGN